jgi:hypothetical protein
MLGSSLWMSSAPQGVKGTDDDDAIGLTTDGSSTVHIYTQTVHRTTQLIWKSAGRAPSLRVILWNLPYN